MPQHLFEKWDEVAARIERARSLRLFLDFDGTLVAIRRSPEGVTFSRQMRQVLDRISSHRRVTAVIVSGRRRGALRRYVRLPRVQYWGLYGWERGPMRRLPRAAVWELSRVRASLVAGLRDRRNVRGVRLEDKQMSVSLHTRGASRRAARQAHDLLVRALRPCSHLYVLPGSHVWEVLPREIPGKDAAIRQAVRRLRAPFLPIYVGDDTTDEPAFALLDRGITIKVGPGDRKTHARYWLAGPAEVRGFIERLEGALP
jgi:trehalose 6-phosphate phosphatase